MVQLKSRMKFSSGHRYAHPKSKKMFQRKAWVKLKKTIHIAEKRKSEHYHHPRYTDRQTDRQTYILDQWRFIGVLKPEG